MPKLYAVSFVDWLDLYSTTEIGLPSNVLIAADSIEEAEAKVKNEFSKELDDFQIQLQASEINEVEGYKVQLTKEE